MVINAIFRQVVQGFPSIVVRIRRIAVHKWATIDSNWLEPFSVYSNLDFYDILGYIRLCKNAFYTVVCYKHSFNCHRHVFIFPLFNHLRSK